MASLIHSVLPNPLRNIISIRPDDPVKKCIELMSGLDVGALVVLDDQKQLLGIVSERDIVRSYCKHSVDWNTLHASDIFFRDVTILSPHGEVDKAMQAMTKTKRRHVLIREANEFLAILSIGDLLYHLLEDKSRVIEHLEQYIHT